MQNKLLNWGLRVYYASCLVVTAFVLCKVLQTAESSTYSLMYASWIAPVLWQGASALVKRLGDTSGALGERLRIPEHPVHAGHA